MHQGGIKMFQNKIRTIFLLVILIFFLMVNNVAWAEGEEDELEPAGDEQGLFESVTPDALILLDLSGSMNSNPLGDDSYPYGSSTSCKADTVKCASVWGTSCSKGFCEASKTNCTVNCSRLAIAKRALFNILDSDGNNIINNSDSDKMNIRIGFMRFKDIKDGKLGNDTGGDYTKGAIKLVTKISELGKETGTSYSLTYCGNSTSCASTVTKCTTGECIVGETATGGTPLASALREAKKYLDDHKAADPAKACRAKFVIAVTDGADTFACSGDGTECQANMYIRRREVVAAAKELANAGYKTFIIGFGAGMTDYLKNTLEWAAFHGNSDNPKALNSGSTAAYALDGTATYPSGFSKCVSDTSTQTAACFAGGTSADTAKFKATNYDPGYLPLSGYAFIAEDADQLEMALKEAINTITGYTYAFTQSSIQAVRLFDENYVYEASFEQIPNDPFWIGHLKRYTICSSQNPLCGGPETYGDIYTKADWDAGEILKSRSTARNVYTLKQSSNLIEFNAGNMTDNILNISDSSSCSVECASVVNFIHNGELDSSHLNYRWKLGDIFHSSPMSIATPNKNFVDVIDKQSLENKGFYKFMKSHPRTSKDGTRIILVGANDGQLHAFKAGDGSSGGGTELWSFIPPNLLPRLINVAHSTHPTNLSHEYFVDGPISAAEIWLGSNQEAKDENDWRTYLIISEGRGGINTLWSKSAYCSSDFSPSYSAEYGHYCGYYAFDVSNTLSTPPVFKWKLGGSSAIPADAASYLGQAWSKMVMGRVSIKGLEKWVGFMGGGYSGANCSSAGTCNKQGKGFFVVNLQDGSILKTFAGDIKYDLAATPTVVDYDRDGFIDTAYIGDTGGNLWRFKFCMQSDGTSCDEGSWSYGKLFSNQ